MREIKFRAWDNVNKIMINAIFVGLGKVYGMTKTFKPSKELEDVILMQYTGLKDKNGKEIYEGDIVPIVIEDLGRSIKTVNGIVKFKRGQWNIEYFHPFQKEMYICNLYRLLKRREKEVLGNIYENPELLDRVEEVEEIPIMKGTRKALDKIVI